MKYTAQMLQEMNLEAVIVRGDAVSKEELVASRNKFSVVVIDDHSNIVDVVDHDLTFEQATDIISPLLIETEQD
jgi:hypothetical protein